MFEKTPEKNPLSRQISSVEIGTSAVYRLAVCLLHLCMLVGLWLTRLPLWANLAIASLVLLHGFFWLRRWQAKRPLYFQQQDGFWLLVNDQQRLQLVDCYYSTRWLVVLRLQDLSSAEMIRRFVYLPIFFDACSAEDFRHLRVASRYLF